VCLKASTKSQLPQVQAMWFAANTTNWSCN